MGRIFTIMALSLALWHAPSAVAQQPLPEYYPDSYEMIGPLIGINHQEHYIVILDFALPLDPAARVYTPSTRFGTMDQLRPGLLIGVSRAHRGDPVSDIWILPPDFMPGE